MPRTFNTPNNRAKRRKIISVSLILITSAVLIVYQLVKTRKEMQGGFFLEEPELMLDSESGQPDYVEEDVTLSDVYDDINELHFLIDQQDLRIKDLEAKIEELEGERENQTEEAGQQGDQLDQIIDSDEEE
ncbi:MAG: hypothetical protein GF347_04750 [Candidatus Moranbacteria bacterium]|nr:hypothetical protein [Candidatus Moranbacteria bacterium]